MATKSISRVRWWVFYLLIATSPPPLAAQTTSVIQGRVIDAQGLAIDGAAIIVSGPALISQIKVTSDATGSYRVPGLPPGTYNLRTTKPRFAVKLHEGLMVTVNRILTFNITLDVGMVQDTVTVAANSSQLDTAVSSTGVTILPQQVEQMPLNGRNYLDLLQLVPGVTVNAQVDAGTDASTPILGERGGNAAFLIDGMPASNLVDGGPAAPFSQDSILEFQVLTAGYKAEFGRGSGGVVNAVTKSGTNQVKGSAFFFLRKGEPPQQLRSRGFRALLIGNIQVETGPVSDLPARVPHRYAPAEDGMVAAVSAQDPVFTVPEGVAALHTAGPEMARLFSSRTAHLMNGRVCISTSGLISLSLRLTRLGNASNSFGPF